jgi:hypothetical protein
MRNLQLRCPLEQEHEEAVVVYSAVAMIAKEILATLCHARLDDSNNQAP